MQVLPSDWRLYPSDSPRQCLQSCAHFKFMVRVSAGFSEKVSNFVVVKRSHHRRVSQLPLRRKLRLRRYYCCLVDLDLIGIDNLWILHLKLFTLNVDLVARRLLLSLHLVWGDLCNWIDFSLTLRSYLVLLLILNWVVDMHHIVRLVLVILAREVSIVTFLMLVQRRNAWNIWKERRLLLLYLLLRIRISVLNSFNLLLIAVLSIQS